MKTVHELLRDGIFEEARQKKHEEKLRIQQSREAHWMKGFEGYRVWSEARR